MILALLTGMALAELPPPSLEQHLADHTWQTARAELDSGDAEQAIRTIDAFQTHVTDAPNLWSLAAHAHLALGDRAAAKRELLAAVTAAPDYTAAWSSLAALYSEDAQWSDAYTAWGHVERLVPSGPQSDIGPLRRAEAAAHLGNAIAFETHLREAIHRGFDLNDILASPEWKSFYANPALQDSVRKMATVYAGPEALQRLEQPPAP